MATLQQTLDSLVIPSAFARYDRIVDTAVLAELRAWKSNTELLLNQLDPFDVSVLSISALADLVRVFAPLTAVAQWTSPAIQTFATARLSETPASDRLVAHILTQVVKPIFASSPHPRFHTSSARILPRPADVQDTYVEQPWKEHPGLDETIRWCLLNTESSAYESTWPLFLPPVMTFLDDYQAPYKLLGARLVSGMLTRAPPQLLLRTGLDTLIFNSLTNSLSHLGDQSTPDLIRLVVTTTLQLVELTTPSALPSPGILSRDNEPQAIPRIALSQASSLLQPKLQSIRFSRLSNILSSSLLGTIIMYAPTFLPPAATSAPDPFANPAHVDIDPISETPSQEPMPQKQSFNPTLIAAAQSLPCVLSALGIGAVRFLKGVIPVLAEWLAMPLPVITAGAVNDSGNNLLVMDITLHIASLSSLTILFHTCMPRVGGWSTTIVDAIGRCWIGCLDVESQERGIVLSKEGIYVLKKQLKETVAQLANVHPNVIKNEYATLLAFSYTLFEGLVGGIQ